MKLLVLSSRFPLPLEKGDKLRLFHQIKYLSRFHDITLVSLSEEKLDPALVEEMRLYCRRIYVIPQSNWDCYINVVSGLFKGLPANVGYFYQPGIRKRINEIVEKEQPDEMLVQLIRMVPYVNPAWKVEISLDYMDAFSLRSRRRQEQGGIGSFFWKIESWLLERYEKKIAEQFDRKFIISEVDRMHLQSLGVSGLELLRNGVDTTFFYPTQDSEKEYDILLVGNMSYHPNILAAKYLVEEIALPLKDTVPGLTVLIAGASPGPVVRNLQRDWITVSGYMPDIRKAYDKARIFVAPIFTGSGLQNKILEALSMHLPCITTSLVNDSIGAPAAVLKEANDPQTFRNEIVELLADKNLGKKGLLGRQFVQKHFDWCACCQPLNSLKEKEIA